MNVRVEWTFGRHSHLVVLPWSLKKYSRLEDPGKLRKVNYEDFLVGGMI